MIQKAVEMYGKLRQEVQKKIEDVVESVEDVNIVHELLEKPPESNVSLEAKPLHPLYDGEGVYDFDSETTRKYFEDWDQLRIDGNPEIKNHIQLTILRAESQNEAIYARVAGTLEISPDELKKQVQEKVEQMVSTSDFFVALNAEVLSRVIRENGRWKTQFETGQSGGSLAPHRRASAELQMFGFNISELREKPATLETISTKNLPNSVYSVDRDRRPVYGYLSDDENGVVNRQGQIPPPSTVRVYGKIQVKIRKDIALEKATVTFHDSLSPGFDWPPSPASKPHFTSVDMRTISPHFVDPETRSSKTDWGSDYVEAQFHGQLRLEDIESVHLSEKNFLNRDEIAVVKRIVGAYNEQKQEHKIQIVEF